MENETVCCICGAPAVRMIHGHDYCGQHREGHQTPEVAITPCDICGLPAAGHNGTRNLCAYHLPRMAA